MKLKDPSTRARANKSTSRAVLPLNPQVDAPELPGEGWHHMTVSWWSDIWSSPMAAEYLTADLTGLYTLAYIVDAFWRNPTPGASAEIRLAQRAYGLSPLDRRRLEWTIESVDSAKDKRRRRYETSP